jgi:hypothetical protein
MIAVSLVGEDKHMSVLLPFTRNLKNYPPPITLAAT